MFGLEDLLRLDGAQLDLANDLKALNALARVHEQWTEIRKKAQGFDGVFEFVEALVGEQGEALQKILDKLDLSGIRGDLERIAGKFNKLDPRYRALLQRTQAFDEDATKKDIGLVAWKIAGTRKGAARGTEVSFDLGAQAALELEAGDTWPGNESGVPDPLLRIGFAGGFSASAKVKLPFAAGAVGLGAVGGRDSRLDYYFDVRGDDALYAAAVASRLDDVPSPLDLPSLWKALEKPDFFGLVVRTDGQSSFSVDVSMAEPLALATGVNAKVGLTFKAHVSRAGTFHLRLRKVVDAANQSMSVAMTLERSRVIQHGHEIGLGIEVDLSTLTKRLQEVIRSHEADLHEVLDEYREFLSPGTYLVSQAGERLDDLLSNLNGSDEVRALLSEVARRTLGLSSAPNDKDIEVVFAKQIAAAFDGATGVITDAIGKVVKDIEGALTSKLGTDLGLIPGLSDKLSKLVEGIRDDFKKRVTDTSTEKLGELLGKLDATGAKVSKAAAKGDKVFALIRDAIGKYEQALQRLKDAAGKAANQKLTADFEWESARTRGIEVDADLVFLRPSEAAAAAFEHVVKGDFDAVLAVIGKAHPDIVVSDTTTASQLARLHKGFRSSLVLFGVDVGTRTIFDASAKVLVDGSGNVSVMSEASWKRRVKAAREEREVSFVDVYKLVAAKATERELTIDLAVSQQDEVLKRKELEALVQAFEDAALLPPKTTDDALHVLERWIGTGGEKGVAADVNFALRLDKSHVKPLLRLDARVNNTLAEAEQRKIFHCAVEALIRSGDYEEDEVIASAKFVDKSSGDELSSAIDTLLHKINKVKAKDAGPKAGAAQHQRVVRAKRIHKLGATLIELVDVMGDVYTATPGEDGWDADRYLESQDALRGCLKEWLNKQGFRLFWIAKDLHPRVVAFVVALTSLASAPGIAAPILTLSMTKRTEPSETVLLGAGGNSRPIA